MTKAFLPRQAAVALASRRRLRPRRPEVVALEQRLLQATNVTGTMLSASAAFVAPGAPVTLTAAVRNITNAGIMPSGGTVTFYDGGTAVGSGTLSGGTASLSISSLAAGPHHLTAAYGGSSAFAASRGGGEIFGSNTISTFAGISGAYGVTGDGGPATAAEVGGPSGLAVDASGDTFITDPYNDVVRKVAPDGTISTVAGVVGQTDATGDGGPATAAHIGRPYVLAVDVAGNLFLGDYDNNVVRKVTPGGTISTVAGVAGQSDATGDGGPATAAHIGEPYALVFDAAGDLFIGDYGNKVVRKVAPDGTISTVAGVAGQSDATGDGGPATAAHIGYPSALIVDAAGDLFIGDSENGLVRKVAPGGTISTVAGVAGQTDATGDGGPATAAHIGEPYALIVDAMGDLFIGDYENGVVRKVAPGGTISTVAGVAGTYGSTGDGGPATAAELGYIYGMAFDAEGNLYTSDYENGVVRKVDASVNLFVGTPYLTATLGGTTLTAGGVETVTLTAFNPDGTVDTNFADAITLTSTDPTAAAAGTIQFVNGVATVPVTLTKAGAQTVTLTDAADPTIATTTPAITVAAAAAATYAFTTTAGASAVAGTVFQTTVTVVDQYGNAAVSVGGSVDVSTTDAQALLPTNVSLVNGTATFAVTLRTAGPVSLTVTDPDDALNPGTTSITVTPGAAAILSLTGPAAAVVGQAAIYTVTATDAFGNAATGSTDALGLFLGNGDVPPLSLHLVGGIATIPVTFRTPGTVQLVLVDLAAPSVTATATSSVTATIQGTVFVDMSGTGVRGAGDPVLAGRTVYLDLDGDGQLDNGELSTVTDGAGHYLFTGVVAASPLVREDASLADAARYVVAPGRTAGFGSTDLGVTVLAPVAPLMVTPGLLPAAANANPTAAYVGALYRSVLGRNGSAEEVADWQDYIASSGLGRDVIASIFVDSIEHRQDQVASFYQQYLGRTPDPSASYWVDALRGGATEAQVIQAILNSPEYQAAHASPADLGTALYNDVLARAAGATEQTDFTAAMQAGATPETMSAMFVNSYEAHDQAVASFYEVFLHRQREGGASSGYWTTLLDSGSGTIDEVEVGILASDEYLQDALAGRS